MDNIISRIFTFFDFYSNSVKILFRSHSSYRTTIGAIISLIVCIIFLFIFMLLFSDVYEKIYQKILQYDTKFDIPPMLNITLNKTEHEANINKLDLFFFAFSFQDTITNAFLDENEINKIYNLEIRIGFKNLTKGKIEYPLTLNIKYCNSLFTEEELSIYNEPELVNSFCIDKTQLSIQGNYLSEIYQFISIKLKECIPNSSKECLESHKIKKIKERTDFHFLYSEGKINQLIKDKSPIEYSLSRITVQLNSVFYQKFDFYLRYETLISFDNIFFPGSSSLSFINNYKIDKYLSNPDIYSLAIYLRSDSFNTIYVRRFKSFLDFLAEIGGIWKFLLFLGALIAIPINKKIVQLAIANDVFNMVPGNIDEQDYDYYRSMGTPNNPHHIIKFHNKTKIESDFTIEYYKYERNRGMDYSLKEIILSAFPGTFLPEKLQMKEIIYNISQSLLMKKFNILSIYNFSKQINLFKNIIFLQKALFFRYSQKYTLYEDKLVHLNNIFEYYNILKCLSSEQKALIKEYYMINGIRAIKVKPILDEIDYFLIKKLKFDSNFIQKYFINHKQGILEVLK